MHALIHQACKDRTVADAAPANAEIENVFDVAPLQIMP